MMFVKCEWDAEPPKTEDIKGGVRVNRNVERIERIDPESGIGKTVFVGETATMSEVAYAAYAGAVEVEAKREAETIDDYTLALIEGGVI